MTEIDVILNLQDQKFVQDLYSHLTRDGVKVCPYSQKDCTTACAALAIRPIALSRWVRSPQGIGEWVNDQRTAVVLWCGRGGFTVADGPSMYVLPTLEEPEYKGY